MTVKKSIDLFFFFFLFFSCWFFFGGCFFLFLSRWRRLEKKTIK
jgi:hypothetical protein